MMPVAPDRLAAPTAIPLSERAKDTVSEVFARFPKVAAILLSQAHVDLAGLPSNAC